MQSLKNLSGLYLKILILRQGARPFSIFANISYKQQPGTRSVVNFTKLKSNIWKTGCTNKYEIWLFISDHCYWHFKHDIWCLLLRQKRRLILRLTFVQFDVDVFKCFLYRCSKILRTEMYSLQTKAKFWEEEGEMQN